MTFDHALDIMRAAVMSTKNSGLPTLSQETRIESLALNSLDEVEIMMFIEEKTGIHVEQEDFNRCQTLGEFAELIVSNLIP